LMVKSGSWNSLPYVSRAGRSLGAASSEARDDRDVDEDEATGESKGEWRADVEAEEASCTESTVAVRLAAGRGRNVLDGIFFRSCLRAQKRRLEVEEMRGGAGQEGDWVNYRQIYQTGQTGWSWGSWERKLRAGRDNWQKRCEDRVPWEGCSGTRSSFFCTLANARLGRKDEKEADDVLRDAEANPLLLQRWSVFFSAGFRRPRSPQKPAQSAVETRPG
jgi:hypothetical protein